MITSREVLTTAQQTGFRSEVVEKVLRLNGILNRLLWAWASGMWAGLEQLQEEKARRRADAEAEYIGRAKKAVTSVAQRMCGVSGLNCTEVSVVIGSEPNLIVSAAFLFGAHGITLGNTIYVKDASVVTEYLVAHELTHSWRYQQWGAL